MEEIEYLEEYEDLILPNALHYLEEVQPDANLDDVINEPQNEPQHEPQNEPQNDLNPTFSSNVPEYNNSECLSTPNCSTKKRSNRIQIINNEVLKTPAMFKNFFKDASAISSFPTSSDIQQPSPSITYETCNVSFLDSVTHNPVLQTQDKYKNVATIKPNIQRTLSSIIPPFGSPETRTQTASHTECAQLLDVNIPKENTSILGLEVEKHCVDDYNLEFDLNTEDISDICSDSMNFSDEYNEEIFNLESILPPEGTKKKKLKRKNLEGTDSEVHRKKSKQGTSVIPSNKIRKTGETNVNNVSTKDNTLKKGDQFNSEKKKIHSSGKKSKLVVKKNGKKFVFLDRSKFSLKNRNALNNSKDETQGTPTTETLQIETNYSAEQDIHTNDPENISSEKQENILSPLPNSEISPSSRDSINITLATKASIDNNEKVIFSSPKNMTRISQPFDCEPPIHERVSTTPPIKSTGLTFGTFSLKSIKPPSSLQIKDATPKHFSFQPQTEPKLSSPQAVSKGLLPTEQNPENKIHKSLEESQNSKVTNEETSSSENDIDGVLQKENDLQNLPATDESPSDKANKEPVSELINKVELLKTLEIVTDSSLESNNAKINHTDITEEKDHSETPKSVSDISICKSERSLEKTNNHTDSFMEKEQSSETQKTDSSKEKDQSPETPVKFKERDQSPETPKTKNKISKNAKIINHTDISIEKHQSSETPKSVFDSSIEKTENKIAKIAKEINHTIAFKERDQSSETPKKQKKISKNAKVFNDTESTKESDRSADTPKTQNKISKNVKKIHHTDGSKEKDQSSETPKSVSDSSVSKNDNLLEKTVTKKQNCCAKENTNAKNINYTVFSTADGPGDFSKEKKSIKPNVPNKAQTLENVLDISVTKTDMSRTKTEKPSSTNKNYVQETDPLMEQNSEVFSEEIKALEPSALNEDPLLIQAPENTFITNDDSFLEKTVKNTPSTKKEKKIVKKLFECPIEKSPEEISKESISSNGNIENKNQLLRSSTENILNNSFSEIDQPVEKTIKSTCSSKENKNAMKNMDADSSAKKSSEDFSDGKICLNGNIPKTPMNEKTAKKEKTSILHCKFELRHFNIRLSKNIVAKLMQNERNQMSPNTFKNISKKEMSRDILGSINNVAVNSICAPIEKPEKSLINSPASSEIKVKGRRGRKKKIVPPVETPQSSKKCSPLPDGINSEVKEASVQKSPSPGASANAMDRGKKKSVLSPKARLTNESVNLNSTDEARFEIEATVKKSSPGLHKEINSLTSIPNLTKENISNQPFLSNGIISEGKEKSFQKLSSVSVEEKKSLRPVPVSRRDSPSKLRCQSIKKTIQGVSQANVEKPVDILETESNILADKIQKRLVRQVSRKATRQTTLRAKEISQPQTNEASTVATLKAVKERNLIMRKELNAIETPAALTDVCLSNKINVKPNKNAQDPLDVAIIVEPKKELDDETLVPQCKMTNLLINNSLLDPGNKIKSSESPDAITDRNLSGLNIYPNLSDSCVDEQSIPKYTVLELPAYIVMKTKIISRKDLESSKRFVPPVIKQRPESESENTPTETIVKTERPEFNTVCAQINSLLEQNANYLKFASGSERLTRMNNVLADYSLSPEIAKCTLKFLQSYLSSGPKDKAIKTKGQKFIPIYDSQKKIIGYRKRTIHAKPTSSSSSLSSRRNSRRTSKLVTQSSLSVTTVNVFRNPNVTENNPEFSTKIEPDQTEGVDSEMIVPDPAPSNVSNLNIKNEDNNVEEEIAGP